MIFRILLYERSYYLEEYVQFPRSLTKKGLRPRLSSILPQTFYAHIRVELIILELNLRSLVTYFYYDLPAPANKANAARVLRNNPNCFPVSAYLDDLYS